MLRPVAWEGKFRDSSVEATEMAKEKHRQISREEAALGMTFWWSKVRRCPTFALLLR